MTQYEDVRNATNWGNAIGMAILKKNSPDFQWYRDQELGFWAKLGLWLRGKL